MAIEIPRRGSRGARIPKLPAPVQKLGLRFYEWVMRRRQVPMAHLTTVGARSGEPRTVPLRPFPDGPDRWLVIASYGGAARNPAWLHNLAAHPDQIELRVNGVTYPVRAETLSGQDYTDTWPRIVAEQPQFAAYQSQTDRQIPVVRLTRVNP